MKWAWNESEEDIICEHKVANYLSEFCMCVVSSVMHAFGILEWIRLVEKCTKCFTAKAFLLLQFKIYVNH